MQLALWSVPALRLWPTVVLGMLSRLPTEPDPSPGIKIGADLRFWQQAAWFALELLTRQRFQPALLEADSSYRAVWQPMLEEGADRTRLEHLAAVMPPLGRGPRCPAGSVRKAGP